LLFISRVDERPVEDEELRVEDERGIVVERHRQRTVVGAHGSG